VGSKYWKFTIDGTNIFLFNLLVIVAFTIVDYWLFRVTLDMHGFLTSQGLIFALALFSIIPLAYFIGQAVASISAQSSMGVGATVNAFFSTVVEVYLYCIALAEGKAQLVEGSIIGSIFAGILFLPGLSMCFGALKRKTQRFNVQSAGVTSTMMLFAMIGAFGPTLFYQIYGSVSPSVVCITQLLVLTSPSMNSNAINARSKSVPGTVTAGNASTHKFQLCTICFTRKRFFPTSGFLLVPSSFHT
jgi:Ca2+:H+ antiporter